MTVIYILCICICVGILLYLWAIMPHMVNKPDMAPFQEWLYAHRGLHNNETDAPENSMKAFQRAVEAGYGIELDIQLSKDGIPVVFHDFTLERICGAEGRVGHYTYEELQRFTLFNTDAHIPKFEDVLQLVDGKVPLIVEFKLDVADVSLCTVADEYLKKYRGMYCMESFSPFAVAWYRKNRPEVVRGQLAENFYKGDTYRGIRFFAIQNLLLNFMAKPDFVAYNHEHHTMLSRRICRYLYRNTAVAWTIRSEKELAEARKHFDMFIFEDFQP